MFYYILLHTSTRARGNYILRTKGESRGEDGENSGKGKDKVVRE